MNNKPYNIYFNNSTGRVIVSKNNNSTCRRIPSPVRKVTNKNDADFNTKLDELYKYTNITNPSANIDKKEIIKNEELYKENPLKNNEFNKATFQKNNELYKAMLQKNNEIHIDNNLSKYKKDLTYGIKKTILTDFNYLYNSSNNNDFIIGLNKNLNKNNIIFDCFYLFPNISEINTKNETNIINEKKIDIFKNINNEDDIQYFPIDFVACGISIPLKAKNYSYKKIIIKNIFWNIFQSINISKYTENEILALVPNRNDFIYKKIKLQINFELHSQVSNNIITKYGNLILPYKNLNIKNVTPANSCLYNVLKIDIDTLNGVYFDDIEFNLLPDLNIQCALLCIKISVSNESVDILKGNDKNNSTFYGNIPFSQFILNFDYEIK